MLDWSILRGENALCRDARYVVGIATTTNRTVTADHEARLERADDYYVAKGFEYFQVTKAAVGYPDLPDLAILDNLAAALVENLERYCLDVA